MYTLADINDVVEYQNLYRNKTDQKCTFFLFRRIYILQTSLQTK